jgi:hypothetical protein
MMRAEQRASGARRNQGGREFLAVCRKAAKNRKGCDIGYALAAGSCEGVNCVDACTVTASDVTTAFAAFDPNPPLAKFVGFFGSKRSINRFTEQSPSLLRVGDD